MIIKVGGYEGRTIEFDTEKDIWIIKDDSIGLIEVAYNEAFDGEKPKIEDYEHNRRDV